LPEILAEPFEGQGRLNAERAMDGENSAEDQGRLNA
jgi:hypothetical protein